MSRLAALRKRKFVLLGLLGVIVVCVLLFPRHKTAAEYCIDAELARRNYEKTISSNNIDRASGDYITILEATEMQRREQATAQIAETLQRVCEDQQRMEAEDAEMADLQTRFDLSRFSSYTGEQRRAVLEAAGFVDSLAQPPSLSSFDGKLALLRTFRDHPELYH